MAEEFADWLWKEFRPSLWKKLKDIWNVLKDTITKAGNVMLHIIAWIILIAILIVTFLLWLPPFLYWYFAIWKKGEEENGREESN